MSIWIENSKMEVGITITRINPITFKGTLMIERGISFFLTFPSIKIKKQKMHMAAIIPCP